MIRTIAFMLSATLAAAIYAPSWDQMNEGEWNLISPGGDTGCAFGDSYFFLVKKGNQYNKDKFMIEFQGGGSCFDWESCSRDEAMDDATVGYSLRMLGMTNQLPEDLEEDDILAFSGLLTAEDGGPTTGWSKIYVPHCTQDWHIGAKTTIYEDDDGQDDQDDDNQKDDDDDDEEQEEEEDRSITWNHNGVNNANSALGYMFDYISNPDQVLMTGCGLRPYTAAYFMRKLYGHYGGGVHYQVFSDSGVGLIPMNFVENKLDNWGAGCVVGKLFDDEGTYNIHQDDFWNNYFTLEHMWEVGKNLNKNVEWLLFQDIDDEYAQEMYEEMNEDEGNKQGDEDYVLKSVVLLEGLRDKSAVNMYLINGEQEEQNDDDNQDDNDEDDDNNNEKAQDARGCYQAGYLALQIDGFSDWLSSALNGNTYDAICAEGCDQSTVEDCNGEFYGAMMDRCGNCPDPQDDDGDGEGEGDDGDQKNQKDDDDDDNADEEEEEVCYYYVPSWADQGNCDSYEEATPTSTRNSNSSSKGGHTVLVTMAILGGFGVAGYLGFVVGKKNLNGVDDRSRLRDDEKPNY